MTRFLAALLAVAACSAANENQQKQDPCSLLGPDAGPDAMPPPPVCNLISQNCPGSGDRCTISATCPDNVLCDTNGNVQPGQECTPGGADNCIAGSVCAFWLPTSSTPTCRPFCGGNSDCTTTGLDVCDEIPGSMYRACRP